MKVVDLNGIWSLNCFDYGRGEEENAHEADYKDSGWLKANVPGVVHLDLIRQKKILHPFYRLNELEVKWIEEKEWWYRKEFFVDKRILEAERVELVFEGLDTFAKVWLNGERIGDFSNMFIEHKIDVKNFLKEGRNVLAIKFDSPKKILEEIYNKRDVKLGAAFYPPRVYGRKAQYSFGWDWGPRLPTSGIWRPVSLRAYDTCVIDSFYIKPHFESFGKSTKVVVEVCLDAIMEEEVQVNVSMNGYGYVGNKIEKRKLTLGKNLFIFDFVVEKPNLWWPNGYGDQALYNLDIEVKKKDATLDKLGKKVAIRRIEVVREKDEEGESFYFKVNGVPVFCKGANWIPSDSFLPQISRERYEYLLTKAKEANMNMLRVWGGGIYEDEAFYEICDEKGIMVWQDFMFACGEYPEEEWFLDECRREAEEVVKRLRSHACIAIWCGNNENDWGVKANWFGKKDRFYGYTIYHKILPEVCRVLDPLTFYWPSSPYGGEDPNSQNEGDRHSWDVWSGFRDYEEYLKDNGRFVSEFGFQSLPSLATIKRYTAPEDRYPQSRVIEHHNKQEGGPERLTLFLGQHFKVPSDLKMFSYLTQIDQGEAMKTGIMHWRRRKFRSAGALIWQLDDCWPVASWSLIDYYGDPKASYYYTKRAFDNITLSLVLNGNSLEAWVVNDLLEEKDATLNLIAFKSDGKRIFSKVYDFNVSGNCSKLCASISLYDIEKSDHTDTIVCGILKVHDMEDRYDTLSLNRWKYVHLKKPKIRLKGVKALDKDGKRFKIKVVSDKFVKALKIEIDGNRAIFSDNCYDAIPRVERCLDVYLERALKTSKMRRRIKFLYYC